jgi:pyrimidine-nucleoside phosphorylase
VLKGQGEARLTELSLTLASYMLTAAKKAESVDAARAQLERTIADGSALRKMAEFVERQGGDKTQVYEPDKLPRAKYQMPVTLERSGYLTRCVNREVGIASLLLGGGRETKDSVIDLSVGIVLQKQLGDAVKAGDVLGVIHGNDQARMQQAASRLLGAYTIADEPVDKEPLIKAVIS